MLYFILFLLPANAFYVAEELVLLITSHPMRSTIIDYRAFQMSALAKKQQREIKNERGGPELYDGWCIKSQNC